MQFSIYNLLQILILVSRFITEYVVLLSYKRTSPVLAGFRVLSFDLQGHGRSDAALGLRGYVDRFDDYVEDLQSFLESILKPPGKPL